jgi:DNA-binding PadR family transcriptional regulator
VPLDRKLSPLEMSALGTLWKHGPMTAYALMKSFENSGAAYYRSGAGSIYPLVKRLAEAGLLTSEGGAGKSERAKSEKLYSTSEAGRQALRDWLTPPFDGEEFTCALDLFRSRAYMLNILPPEERERFFVDVTNGLRMLERRVQAILDEYRQKGDEVDVLAATGALYETQARLKWIRMMRAKLKPG